MKKRYVHDFCLWVCFYYEILEHGFLEDYEKKENGRVRRRERRTMRYRESERDFW